MKTFLKHYWYSVVLCLGFLWLMALGQSIAVQAQDDPGTGSISGVVTNAQGQGVPDIPVTGYMKVGEPENFYLQPVNTVPTDASGAYTLTNLFSGTYQIAFEAFIPTRRYADEIYDNVTTWAEATDIPLGAGQTRTGINATLGLLGQISGTVTNNTGAPIPDVFVIPIQLTGAGEMFNAAVTDSSGHYTITGLPPAVYGIYFESIRNLAYQSEYYNNVYDLADAQPITIAVDSIVRNIDAVLHERGRLQGVVTDDNGSGLPNINVSVSYSSSAAGFWQPLNNVTTAADGRYEVQAIGPGSYRLGFIDQHTPKRYVDEYYDDRATFEEATDIAIPIGSVITGFDASLAAIDLPGATISGTVTGSNGAPLGLMHVLAYRVEDATPESNNWPVASDDFTNAQGHYKLIGLPPGAYRVEFRDDTPAQQFATEFYDNAASLQTATNIPVSENAVVTDIDAQLGRRGSISGRVTDLAGNPPTPPDSVFVMLSQDPTGNGNWNFLYGVSPNASGVYSFPNLTPGIYHVGFMGTTGYRHLYNVEYYDDAPFFSQATPIVVAPETDVTGIDARLGPQGSIYGRVTDSEGNPLVGLPTTLYHFDLDINGGTWRSLGPLYTEEDGVYRWGGLRYGAYRLHVAETNAQVAEFYQDAATFDTATTLTLTEEAAALTNIDLQLANKGYITGQVTSDAGTPLVGIQVDLYIQQLDGANQPYWSYSRSTNTDETGHYKLAQLPTGVVRLTFIDQSNQYVSEYYNNAATLATATDIPSGDEEVRTVDVQLTPFGRLTGTVTTESNQPLPSITVMLEKEITMLDGSIQWQQEQSVFTNEDGEYQFGHLSGRYRVFYVDQRTNPGAYATEFYANASGPENATVLTVKPGDVITEIDAQLTLLGRLHGTVTDEEGNPLLNIGVTVYSDPKGTGDWQLESYLTGTDSQGVYTYFGLKTGRYRIYFRDNMWPNRYSAEYYDNATNLLSATTVTVTNGATTTVDAQLGPLGTITGKVTDPNGNPLPTAQVSMLTDQDGNGQWEGGVYFTMVDASGVYTFTGLNSGVYRLYFQDYTQVYAPEFYDDSLTLAGAINVTVTTGAVTPNINAQLDYYSHLTGTVTDETGAPLTNIFVTAYRWRADAYGNFDWFEVNSQYTNNEGHYNMGGLITGVYRLRFADTFNNFLHTEYYDDAGYVYTADDIDVGVAMTVTNINAQLSPFTAVNYPPLVRDDEAKVMEGGTTNSVQFGDISLLANDRDAEFMPITPTLVTSPTHGVVTLLATGLFTYTHNGDNATSDHFTYKVNDGVHDSNVATVTITITPTNDAPLAVNDSYTLTTGATLTGSNVLANDSDEEGDVLTATLVTSPTHGVLTLATNGVFTYTYDDSETLTDTFTYVASDGITTSNVATVNLIISPTTPLVSFTLSKTVGIDGIKPLCTATGEMKVPAGTAVVYCYTVRNTGSTTLTTHSLVDSDLGQLLDNVTYALAPGAAYSVTFTKTLTVSITNVATWTATIADVGQTSQRTIPGATGSTGAAATVLISGPTDDQDGDTIPDNLEGWSDPDGDNIPNFLDTNADGDSKSDQEEVGDPTSPTDSDKDGVPDFLDNDGAVPGLNLKQFLPLIHK